MSKIKEIILEPSKMRVGDTFKIKVRAIRHATYAEIKDMKIQELEEYTVGELKGD